MTNAAFDLAPDESANAEPVAVVLCCTQQDVEVVTSLAERLRSAHQSDPQVVLLEGETFTQLRELAQERAGSTVLYVLCRGSEISVSDIQQVRTVLRGHAGGQFMTVQVSSVERMESALAAALEGPRFRQQEGGTPPPATIRGTPGAANGGPGLPPPRPRLPGPRGMMTVPPKPPAPSTSGPRTLVGGVRPGSTPPTNSSPRTLMGAAPGAPAQVQVQPPPPRTLLGAAPNIENDMPPSVDTGPRTLQGKAPPPEDAFEDDLPYEEGKAVVNGRVGEDDEDQASVSGSATVTFGISPEFIPPSLAPTKQEQEPAKWYEPHLAKAQELWQELWSSERRNLKLGIAGAVIVLIPTIALLAFSGGSSDDEDKQDEKPAQIAPAQKDRVLANLDPSQEQPPGEALKAQGPKGAVPDAARYQEFLKAEAALKSSRVRGLDSLLIDVSRSKKYNFKRARRYCNRRETGKLSGWRLPTGKELGSIAGANMLGKKNSYWAQAGKSSKSKRTFVWDVKRNKLVKKAASFRGARAVCVRKRVAGQ